MPPKRSKQPTPQRLLERYIAEKDRERWDAERKANPLLALTCASSPPRTRRLLLSHGRTAQTPTKELLAWIEARRPSQARDTLLVPLRKAVTRKHAFAILFQTV